MKFVWLQLGVIQVEQHHMVVARTGSDNNTRHSSPEVQDSFATGYAHCTLNHALVGGPGRGAYYLHSGLRALVSSNRRGGN